MSKSLGNVVDPLAFLSVSPSPLPSSPPRLLHPYLLPSVLPTSHPRSITPTDPLYAKHRPTIELRLGAGHRQRRTRCGAASGTTSTGAHRSARNTRMSCARCLATSSCASRARRSCSPWWRRMLASTVLMSCSCGHRRRIGRAYRWTGKCCCRRNRSRSRRGGEFKERGEEDVKGVLEDAEETV